VRLRRRSALGNDWGLRRLLLGHADGETLAPLRAAALQYLPPRDSLHPLAEAVGALPALVVGLVRPLAHLSHSWSGKFLRSPLGGVSPLFVASGGHRFGGTWLASLRLGVKSRRGASDRMTTDRAEPRPARVSGGDVSGTLVSPGLCAGANFLTRIFASFPGLVDNACQLRCRARSAA